jgi:hypothetical protein
MISKPGTFPRPWLSAALLHQQPTAHARDDREALQERMATLTGGVADIDTSASPPKWK